MPGAVVVVRGLDARSARGQKTEAEVNERLQQVVPSDIAILVDWKGDLVQAYERRRLLLLGEDRKAGRSVILVDEGLVEHRVVVVRPGEDR